MLYKSSQNVKIMQPMIRNQQQILPSFQQNNIQQMPFIQQIHRSTNLKQNTNSDKNIFPVIICNIDYSVKYQQLYEFCSECGEISQLNYSYQKGLAICVYFDLRAANNAIKNVNGKLLNKRIVLVKYASSILVNSIHGGNDTCSKVIIKALKEKSILDLTNIQEILKQFGEIKACNINNKSQLKKQWNAQYFDFRSAKKCVKTQKITVNDEDLTISFAK